MPKSKDTAFWGTGRRKTAVARVKLVTGNGAVTKEGEPLELPTEILEPLTLVGKREAVDVSVKVHGGGVTGQLEAIRHGLARAVAQLDPDTRTTLRKAGFLTRDAREKERKKFGLKKARRAPQWSKR